MENVQSHFLGSKLTRPKSRNILLVLNRPFQIFFHEIAQIELIRPRRDRQITPEYLNLSNIVLGVNFFEMSFRNYEHILEILSKQKKSKILKTFLAILKIFIKLFHK